LPFSQAILETSLNGYAAQEGYTAVKEAEKGDFVDVGCGRGKMIAGAPMGRLGKRVLAWVRVEEEEEEEFN